MAMELNGRDIDGRADSLHHQVLMRSMAAQGAGAWSMQMDQDAAVVAQVTEAAWHRDGLTMREAIALMHKNFQKITEERRIREEAEAAEAVAVAAATAASGKRNPVQPRGMRLRHLRRLLQMRRRSAL